MFFQTSLRYLSVLFVTCYGHKLQCQFTVCRFVGYDLQMLTFPVYCVVFFTYNEIDYVQLQFVQESYAKHVYSLVYTGGCDHSLRKEVIVIIINVLLWLFLFTRFF